LKINKNVVEAETIVHKLLLKSDKNIEI